MSMKLLAGCAALALFSTMSQGAEPLTPGGWHNWSPREEIAPKFTFVAQSGPDGKGAWIIETDARDGRYGCWVGETPVEGGKCYRFSALYRQQGCDNERQSVFARLLWRDADGKPALRDELTTTAYEQGKPASAEPLFPLHRDARDGWTEVSDCYRAPQKTAKAVVELYLKWQPNARVEWSRISLTEIPEMPSRKVRLATVLYRPEGGTTPMENARQFEPLIAKVAEQKADLVVLPEVLTAWGTGKPLADAAEPVPGPVTDYFGALAKKYNLYVVAGLVERDAPLVYNVAVLIGPDGKIVGKYRKCALTFGEVGEGFRAGNEYPVFDTRFGKVGMMICYDGFFPEVARQLAIHGADVIAWPVAGCNPVLAQARANENHVYIVSSTYCGPNLHWMISGIFGQDGPPLAQCHDVGDVVVAEVDLENRPFWPTMGDFKALIPMHRPPWVIAK